MRMLPLLLIVLVRIWRASAGSPRRMSFAPCRVPRLAGGPGDCHLEGFAKDGEYDWYIDDATEITDE